MAISKAKAFCSGETVRSFGSALFELIATKTKDIATGGPIEKCQNQGSPTLADGQMSGQVPSVGSLSDDDDEPVFGRSLAQMASKECTMFHAVLMNGATPACSSVLSLFATSVFLQAENVSRLSSPGTRRHVGTNLSSVFSLWQCVHAHQQPRP
ncbi:hypothetical protein DPX16_12846 [Anabarilius grahami]|uniref:Uncharacterized protein n=1 Tax=Anabarilius grahami TaxID=495550 RepID=A0A3N0XD50_ANAGA|nr:hypothetical protein DPX16_12846 [Anabarilius grahami]